MHPFDTINGSFPQAADSAGGLDAEWNSTSASPSGSHMDISERGNNKEMGKLPASDWPARGLGALPAADWLLKRYTQNGSDGT